MDTEDVLRITQYRGNDIKEKLDIALMIQDLGNAIGRFGIILNDIVKNLPEDQRERKEIALKGIADGFELLTQVAHRGSAMLDSMSEDISVARSLSGNKDE